MTWTPYLAFAGTMFLLAITPGPAVLLTIAHGMRNGWGASLKAGWGVQAGNGIYFLASAVGLGAILSTSELLFQIVKWAGAAYLIWLGLRSIRNARDIAPDAPERVPLLRRPFQQAVMTQLANPKSILSFGALMPQFIQPGVSLPLQYGLFALICVVTEMPVLATYGWLASRGKGLFQTPGAVAWRERIAGLALIAVGLSLAAIRWG